MDYKIYSDKVYGCWLGKCVCGSIGAPLEGCKQLFDYQFSPSFWRITKPNDDLELQILWLNVLEQIGLDFDADDLARAFLEHVPYNPGEYAYFKRNYRRGIHPPTSGTYNNHFYHQGMGCCIRAEIWACLAAGDPALAGRICRSDGQLDHSAESVYSESFIAAMEAAAFVENDIDLLIAAGLAAIPAESKLAKLINDTQHWCRNTTDWRLVREQVIRHYGHPDCTNMFENIGITLLALLLSEGDLEKATMIALNSGFDTDCTCGIVGAIFGILHGAAELQRKYGIVDTGFITNFDVNRPSDRIEVLANDIARLTLEAERFWQRTLKVTGAPEAVQSFRLPVRRRILRFETDYDDLPVLTAGGTSECTLRIFNLSAQPQTGRLNLKCGKNLSLEYSPEVTIAAGTCASIPIRVCHLDKTRILDGELINAEFLGCTYDFGFAAATPWQVYGPYWANVVTVPQVDLCGEHYQDFISSAGFLNRSTAIRNYHLNMRAGLDVVGLDETALACGTLPMPPHTVIQAVDDLIPVDDAFGFQGPAVFYLVSEFITDKSLTGFISLGHSCPIVFYLDGRELVRAEHAAYRTPENLNLESFELSPGKHRVMIKVARESDRVTLSVNFRARFRPQERLDAHVVGLEFLTP